MSITMPLATPETASHAAKAEGVGIRLCDKRYREVYKVKQATERIKRLALEQGANVVDITSVSEI